MSSQQHHSFPHQHCHCPLILYAWQESNSFSMETLAWCQYHRVCLPADKAQLCFTIFTWQVSNVQECNCTAMVLNIYSHLLFYLYLLQYALLFLCSCSFALHAHNNKPPPSTSPEVFYVVNTEIPLSKQQYNRYNSAKTMCFFYWVRRFKRNKNESKQTSSEFIKLYCAVKKNEDFYQL